MCHSQRVNAVLCAGNWRNSASMEVAKEEPRQLVSHCHFIDTKVIWLILSSQMYPSQVSNAVDS